MHFTCSALALSTVLRTTSLSYGNMPFSGNHPTKTPWPIVLKFCTVDYVGETIKHAKNGYNRLARGGSPYRWNISIYTLPLLYLTLLYLFLFRYQAYRQDHWTDLHARYLKRRGLLQGSAFWGLIDEKNFSRGNIPSPKFSKGLLHANRKSRITFDRLKIIEKFQNRPIPNRGHAIERWLHFRSSTPPSGRNRLSAIFGNNKSANNVETVQDRR
jgi:hypothetical protein